MSSESSEFNDNAGAVAVIGAGIIGASWAALFLSRGRKVQVYEPVATAETDVRAYIGAAWPALESLGAVSPDWQQRLRFFPTPEAAVSGACFVQENVPERLPLKQALYQRIEPALGAGVIVASSSSGLLLRDMQQGWKDPARFILGHPFNPPHLIPLVEVLGNERTAAGVLDGAERFYRSLGKITIRVRKELPGHVANRLQAALWREAIHLVMEGVVSVADVDTAVTAGPGLRWAVMGPNMLFNLGGGPEGMKGFCDRYEVSMNEWWKTLGTPELSAIVGRALSAGLIEEQAGRDLKAIASGRDQKIVAVLRALRETQEQSPAS